AIGVSILLPAPGNLHSHTFQRAMAGMTEARGPAGRDSFWTWRELMYRFLDRLGPDEIEAIAALVFVEMLEAGYAAVAEFHYLHHAPGGAPYDDPAELSARIAAAAAETGIGLTLLPVLYMQGGTDGRPLTGGQRRFGNGFDGYLRLLEGAERAAAAIGPDARTGVAPHSLRAVPVEALTDLAQLRPDAPIHMHIAEQEAEIREVLATHGATPVRWLLEIQDVGPRWCLIHCTHMTPEETAGLARSGAVAGLCPITESNLGDGIFDGARYLAEGGRFGVGSDSNVRITLSEELRTLEYSQRLRDRARAVLASPGRSAGRTLFEGAASGSAQALGRDAGAIRPGAWADLAALDGAALAVAGLDGDALLDGWIFAGDDRLVTEVWSAGRHVVTDGRHIGRDRVEARYRTAIARLRNAI
ncbi:MAG TPA: formimidoylglutamate deiminase, partial [Paracoccaceae bacterium]|nr:formimidoylglutamate deiminase [Paracoccaceae bacterium]